MKKLTAIALSFAVLAGPALAQVKIEDPWVRATVPQQKVTGAFMRITSAQDARLVSVQSPLAGKVELHEMAMQNDVMKMRPVAAVELPAGTAVELKPGAHHIMLFDLQRPMVEGESVPFMLVIEGKDGQQKSVEVSAPVRPLNAAHGGVHGN